MKFLSVFVLSSAFLSIFSNSSKPKFCPDSKTSIEFYLSKAIISQNKANLNFQKSSPNYKKHHAQALEYFSAYEKCASEIGKIPSKNFKYLKALSLAETNSLNESLLELEKNFEKEEKPHKESLILKARILQKKNDLKESAEILEQAISFYSDDSDLLYYLGVVHAELGNLPKATLYLTSLYQLIQKKDGDPKYKLNSLKFLGDIYYKKADIPKAIYYYKLYLDSRENDTEISYTIAQLYFISGDISSSKKYLNQVLKFNPGSNSVIQLLAEFHFIENKLNSLKYFDKLKKENKFKDDGLLEAIYQLLLDKIPDSNQFVTKYLEKNPKRISARLAKSLISLKLNENKEYLNELKILSEIAYSNRLYFLCTETLKQILEHSEKNPDLKINKSEIYNFLASSEEESDNPFNAIGYLKKALENTNNETDKNSILIHLATVYRNPKVSKFEESNKILTSLTEQTNNILFLKGANYFSLGKYNDSISEFSLALEKKQISSYYFFRASSYEKLNQIPRTISDLKKAIELDNLNPMYYNYLGYLYTENNLDLIEAEKYIKRAIELEPDNSSYQDSLGWLYYKKGQYREAVHHLQLALQIILDKKEEDAVIYDHLGDAYFKLKEIEKSAEYWKKASELQKNSLEKEKINLKLNKINR